MYRQVSFRTSSHTVPYPLRHSLPDIRSSLLSSPTLTSMTVPAFVSFVSFVSFPVLIGNGSFPPSRHGTLSFTIGVWILLDFIPRSLANRGFKLGKQAQ